MSEFHLTRASRALPTLSSVLLATTFLALQPSIARAATAPSDSLEEVIITAEKRSENLQKAPVSVTAIVGEDIERKGEDQLDTLLRDVPSLQIEATPQGGAVYVRGVGTNGDSNFIDPSVALNIDGVYSARSERLSAATYDVNRIEVARGPQGTLVGRNADGGAINLLTNDPVLGKYETRLNLQGGNYSLKHGDFSENLGFNERFAVRLAGLVEDRDGYFSNDGYASHVVAGRGKALWQISGDWSLSALVDYSRQHGNGTTTVPVAGGLPSPPFPAGGWQTQAGNPWYVDSYHPADVINYRFATVALQSDSNFGWGKLIVVPTQTKSVRDVTSNLVVGNYFGPITPTTSRETQRTLEVRLVSPDSARLTWVLGYYYLWNDNVSAANAAGLTNTYSSLPNAAPGSAQVVLFQTNNAGASAAVSKAPYGQIKVPVTDTFRIGAGLRYTQDTKSQASQITSVYVPGYDSGFVSYTNNYSAFTYNAGVEYDAAKESMLYAQLSRGYKAGGFSTTADPPKPYLPEYVRAYEVGSKNRFLQDHLQLNAAVFVYDYDQLQVQYSFNTVYPVPLAYLPAGIYDPTQGENPTPFFQQYVANAGSGTNKGGEIEMKYRVSRTDEVDISATYVDSHYGQFNLATDPQLANLSGQEMAFTPKFTAILGYEHDWFFAAGQLSLQIDSKYSSSYVASVNNRGSRPAANQDSYTRTDVTLAYDSGAAWRLSAWVKNVENKAQVQFGDFPLNRNVINGPRTFGVNLGLHF